MSRYCICCGDNIDNRPWNCPRCKTCQRNYRLELVRYYKDQRIQKQKLLGTYRLGTGELEAHRDPDFTTELKLIRAELRRLGLRKSQNNSEKKDSDS